MTDFQIKKGLSTSLFDSDGNCILSPELLVENCWYLTIDTAEVFVALRNTNGELVLEKINSTDLTTYTPGFGLLLDNGEFSIDTEVVVTNDILNGVIDQVEQEFETSLEEQLTPILSTVNQAGKDIQSLEAASKAITRELQSVQDNISELAKLASIIPDVESRVDELVMITDDLQEYKTVVYTKEETEAVILDAISEIPPVDLTGYAQLHDVYTKDEADLTFVASTELQSEVNKMIVDANPEGTIVDFSTLITAVEDHSTELSVVLDMTQNMATALKGIETTVVDYVDSKIKDLKYPTASEEITMDSEGVLGIGKVSTDKLEQGEATLVLDGGSANV